VYASREDAGQKLGEFLKRESLEADLVLGLPRGGVVVAAAVARVLDLPLDVLIVRKIGHPLHREYAVGALAEGGVVILDERIGIRNPILQTQLHQVISEEQERLHEYEARFHFEAPPPRLENKVVLLVDDGLATGATTEAAVMAVRRQGARHIMVAAPVASVSAVERLERYADQVKVLILDPNFAAVGRYYEEFSQTTDGEVIQALQFRTE
jgi:putative phosphoribosyl transferase